jgi:hypothetical protein
MKKLNILSAVCVIASSMSAAPSFASGSFLPSMERDLISVCYNAATDNKRGMLKAVDRLGILSLHRSRTIRNLNKGLLCNGQSVVDFAEHYGAVNTLRILKRHRAAPKGDVDITDDVTVALPPKNADVNIAYSH